MRTIDNCEHCNDGFGGCIYPKRGIAPSHPNTLVMLSKSEWPDNFKESVNGFGSGVYTHCPACGSKDTDRKV